MDPLSLTALAHQKGAKAVEAVVGVIDRMDETERELECRRRDGTTFTSALRTLHLKDDEQSVVRLSLWGSKAAVREPRREQLRVGDLLVVTNVQIDRFMGDKAFKASGFRPALRVIRELSTVRTVLDRLGLEEPGPYLKRVEQLWRWKELEDLRDQRMRRQAQQRDAELTAAAAAGAATTITSSGFETLVSGQEDAHVRGMGLPLAWVEKVAKASGKGGGGSKLPPPAPRFLRTKVTDGKGVAHVLDLPQGTEGLLAFEQASRAAAAKTTTTNTINQRYHPLPLLLHCLGARAVGGLLVPAPTPRTRVALLPSSSPQAARATASSRGQAPLPPMSVGATLAYLKQQRQGGGEMVLTVVGRIAGVGVGPERAALETVTGDVDRVVGQLVTRAGAGEDGWRYRDVHLHIVDAEPPPDAAAASSSTGLVAGGLWVRVPDPVLRPLLAHVPAGRLVEEAEVAAAAEGGLSPTQEASSAAHSLQEKEKDSGGRGGDAEALFFARWVPRALAALASPHNPPFRLTVRVAPAAASNTSPLSLGPARGLVGLLASQVPCAATEPAASGFVPPELELLRLAEAPVEGPEEEERDAMVEDGYGD